MCIDFKCGCQSVFFSLAWVSDDITFFFLCNPLDSQAFLVTQSWCRCNYLNPYIDLTLFLVCIVMVCICGIIARKAFAMQKLECKNWCSVKWRKCPWENKNFQKVNTTDDIFQQRWKITKALHTVRGIGTPTAKSVPANTLLSNLLRIFTSAEQKRGGKGIEESLTSIYAKLSDMASWSLLHIKRSTCRTRAPATTRIPVCWKMFHSHVSSFFKPVVIFS